MKFKILFTLFLFCLFCQITFSQTNNYWVRNFNEESSFLSGAVVGGGAGPAAIFYNPATISEIENSNFSLNASLFAIDFFKASNAWGEEIDYRYDRFQVIPRFISIMAKPKNNPKLSFELAFLNNENYQNENTGYVEQVLDILSSNQGEELYNAFYRYYNKYRDDWLGFGTSYSINDKLSVGSSLFGRVKSLTYLYMVDIEAGPLLPNFDPVQVASMTAKHKEQEHLKFINYQMLFKLGGQYRLERIKFGINITFPSISLFAGGEQVMRKFSQSGVHNPETGEPIQNYFFSDYADKQETQINLKSPLSIAAGFNISNKQETRLFYATIEYFASLDPYNISVINKEDSEIQTQATSNELLTYLDGAKQVWNVAIGYEWRLQDKIVVMAGFRTDFNNKKRLDFGSDLKNQQTIKGFNIDRYHFNSGITTKVLGQDLMAGVQYTYGREKNLTQFANLSDPVEYNPDSFAALQGLRQNTMDVMINSISLYLGATIKIGNNKE